MSLALVILLKVIHRCVSVTEVLVDQVSPEPQETFSGKESASATCDPGPFLERGPINGHEHFEYLAPPQCYKDIDRGILFDMLTENQNGRNKQPHKIVEEILKAKQQEQGVDPETIIWMQNGLKAVDEMLNKRKELKKHVKIIASDFEKIVGTLWQLWSDIGSINLGGDDKTPQSEMVDEVRQLIPDNIKDRSSFRSPRQISEVVKVFSSPFHKKLYKDIVGYCETGWEYHDINDQDSDIKNWCQLFVSYKEMTFKETTERDSFFTALTKWFQKNKEVVKTQKGKKKKNLRVKLAKKFADRLLDIRSGKQKHELMANLIHWDIETLVGFTEKDGRELTVESNKISYLNMASIRNELLKAMAKNPQSGALRELHKCTILHYSDSKTKTGATEWIVTTAATDTTSLTPFTTATGFKFHFLRSFTRGGLGRMSEDSKFNQKIDLISTENLAGIDFTGSVNEGISQLAPDYKLPDIDEYVSAMRKVLYGSIDPKKEKKNPTKGEKAGFKRFVKETNKEKLFFRVHMYENFNYSDNRRKHPFYEALYKVLFEPEIGLMTDDDNSWLNKVTFVIGHSNTIEYDKFVAELIQHQEKVAGIQINWNIASNEFIQTSYDYGRTCAVLHKIKEDCQKCKVILGSDGIGIIGTKASIQSQREYIASKKDDSTQAGNRTRKYGRNNDNAHSNSPSLEKRNDPKEQITE